MPAYGARLANLELHGKHAHAGPRYGVDVLDPVDLREHLFHGQRDEILHFGRACAGKSDEHVGEGDIDLRLFLARRHDDCEHAEQHRRKREQWRQGIVLEPGGETARDAEFILHRSLPPAT
jgi:hypothetical protein